jgi:hypothetical protein
LSFEAKININILFALRLLGLFCTYIDVTNNENMKTNTSQIALELLTEGIVDDFHFTDVILTERLHSDPVFLLKLHNSPITFAIGWDPIEKFNVFSVN